MREYSRWFPRTRGTGMVVARPDLWCVCTLALVIVADPLMSFAQPGPKQGGPKPAATKPGAKTAPKPKATPAPPQPQVELDPNTGLPLTFQPLPQIPDLMTLEQPLLTPEEQSALKKEQGKYKSALRGPNLGDKEKELIRNGLKYRLFLMTLKEDDRRVTETREEADVSLSRLRESLTITDLRLAGSLCEKADQLRAFRTFINAEIVKLARELLKNNQPVRQQAAILLGELALTEADPSKQIKFESYIQAAELCAEVIADKTQPVEVRLAAARSATHLFKFGTALPDLKHKVAQPVVAALADPKEHYWYQMRLCQLLSVIDAPLDLQTRKPFIVNALRSVLNDPQRDWLPRSEAARALGRVTLDQADIPGLIRDIAAFAAEVGKAASQQKPPYKSTIKTPITRLYLAFRPYNADDKDAALKNRGGLLYSPSAAAAAKAPFDLILPIITSVVNDQAVTAAQLAPLDQYVAKTKPVGGNAAAPKTGPDPVASSPQ